MGLPAKVYGWEKCGKIYNISTEYESYYFCLMDSGVNPTLKEACGLYATNRTRQLLCYEGKELSNYRNQTVPYS